MAPKTWKGGKKMKENFKCFGYQHINKICKKERKNKRKQNNDKLTKKQTQKNKPPKNQIFIDTSRQRNTQIRYEQTDRQTDTQIGREAEVKKNIF